MEVLEALLFQINQYHQLPRRELFCHFFRDVCEMLFGNGLDGQAATGLANHHAGKMRIMLDGGERDGFGQLFDECDVDRDPARVGFCTGRIIVIVFLIELRFVRMGSTDNLGNAIYASVLIGMIKKGQIALFHIVTHEVARLIVADTGPGSLLVVLEIVYRVTIPFTFQEPVLHMVLEEECQDQE